MSLDVIILSLIFFYILGLTEKAMPPESPDKIATPRIMEVSYFYW